MDIERIGAVMEKWIAYGEFADGTSVERAFPYTGYNTYTGECEAAQDLEAWIIEVVGEKHGGCTFYSVSYTDGYDPEWDCPEYNSREEL